MPLAGSRHSADQSGRGGGRGNENVWFTNYAVRGGVRLTQALRVASQSSDRSASSADSGLRVGGSRVSQSPVSVHHLCPQDPHHHHHRDPAQWPVTWWPGDNVSLPHGQQARQPQVATAPHIIIPTLFRLSIRSLNLNLIKFCWMVNGAQFWFLEEYTWKYNLDFWSQPSVE